MAVKWKEGFNPEVVIKKLSAMRTSHNDDEVCFEVSITYYDCITVLQSMIEINDEDIPDETKKELIIRGFDESVKGKVLDPKNVLSKINNEILKYNSQTSRLYHLLTTINIMTNSNLKKITINNCTIKFYKKLSNKFADERDSIISRSTDQSTRKKDCSSYFLRTSVNSKSLDSAVNQSLDSIDLLRSIWNLYLHKKTGMVSIIAGTRKPINKIMLGEFHTLHDEDGAVMGDVCWYEPDFYRESQAEDLSENMNDLLVFNQEVLSKLKKLHYKKELELLLIRYVRALDSSDYDKSFIQLWGILEALTSTLHDRYDETIKRTVFHFRELEYNKNILEHLRQYRNKSVHAGKGDNTVNINVYQLKRYVEALLIFHINNQFKFPNLNDAGRFMGLSRNVDALEKTIVLNQNVLKYINQ